MAAALALVDFQPHALLGAQSQDWVDSQTHSSSSSGQSVPDLRDGCWPRLRLNPGLWCRRHSSQPWAAHPLFLMGSHTRWGMGWAHRNLPGTLLLLEGLWIPLYPHRDPELCPLQVNRQSAWVPRPSLDLVRGAHCPASLFLT